MCEWRWFSTRHLSLPTTRQLRLDAVVDQAISTVFLGTPDALCPRSSQGYVMYVMTLAFVFKSFPDRVLSFSPLSLRISLSLSLSPARQQYRFDFNLAEKPYESYSGLNVRVRYFVRVTISTRGKNVTREMDFVVQNIQQVTTCRSLDCASGVSYQAWYRKDASPHTPGVDL